MLLSHKSHFLNYHFRNVLNPLDQQGVLTQPERFCNRFVTTLPPTGKSRLTLHQPARSPGSL